MFSKIWAKSTMAKVVHYILSSDSETEDVSPPKASSPVQLCPSTPTPISYAIGLNPSLPSRKRSLDAMDQVYLNDPMVIDYKPQRVDPLVNIDFSGAEVSGKDFRNLPSKRTRIGSFDASNGLSSSIPVDKSMDENVDFDCIEVSGKDFSKIPSKRTRRRLFAPVSVPAKVPELVSGTNDENIDSTSKDFSKVPSKRYLRVFVPVSVPSMLSNVASARLSGQKSEIHGNQCTSVGKNVGDDNVIKRDVLSWRVDGDAVMYEHKGDGLQHPTLVTVKPLVNSCDSSLKCSVTHCGSDNKVYTESQLGKREWDSKDKSGNKIISSTLTSKDVSASLNNSAHRSGIEAMRTESDGGIVDDKHMIFSNFWKYKNVASTLAASVNDPARHPGTEANQAESNSAIIDDKNVKRIISPSLMNKGVSGTPGASPNDSSHDLGTEEKKTKAGGASINDKNVNRILSPSWKTKDFSKTSTASINDSTNHPATTPSWKTEEFSKTSTSSINDSANHPATTPSWKAKDFSKTSTASFNDSANPSTTPSWMTKDFSKTFTASINDSANHPATNVERQAQNDVRGIYQAALEDLSQPKEEANLPDGLLSVPLLKHQKIALAWMVHRETTRLPCVGGILADDQGLGKTVSMIALIQYQRFLQSQSTSGDQMGKKPAAYHLNGDHKMRETVQIKQSNNRHMFPGANVLTMSIKRDQKQVH